MCVFSMEESIENSTAKRRKRCEEWKRHVRNPKYTRGFIWVNNPCPATPSVSSTITQSALRGVPEEDAVHVHVTETIKWFPNLFRIVMPIKVDVLTHLLQLHPNRPLVDSILGGFRKGFWPGAKSELLSALLRGLDNQWREDVSGDATLDFCRMQRDTEVSLGRYSSSFGYDLLPGMVAQPCFAMPKPGTSKFCLINDHTAGKNSLNAAIAPEDGTFR